MRVISISVTLAAALFFACPVLVPTFAQAATSQIKCSQIDDAQHFVDGLKPGPNTTAAQQHLDAARTASQGGHDRQCVSELSRVNYYARRSAAADKRAASGHGHTRHVVCADAMHQNRPGGSDYRGPSYGCPHVM